MNDALIEVFMDIQVYEEHKMPIPDSLHTEILFFAFYAGKRDPYFYY